MKKKHLNTLRNYKKYGEGYSSSTNYMAKNIKMANYGRTICSRSAERSSKLSMHELQKHALTSFNKIVLVGDSIVNGLQRYDDVWQKHFVPLHATNFGIPGDKTQNILWRMEDLDFPPNIEFAFIHCGTNNLNEKKSKAET